MNEHVHRYPTLTVNGVTTCDDCRHATGGIVQGDPNWLLDGDIACVPSVVTFTTTGSGQPTRVVWNVPGWKPSVFCRRGILGAWECPCRSCESAREAGQVEAPWTGIEDSMGPEDKPLTDDELRGVFGIPARNPRGRWSRPLASLGDRH